MPSSDIGGTTFDIRDAIERFEELESDPDNRAISDDDGEELKILTALLEELASNGGDHKWRGDWYPSAMIRDDYFEDYAQELAEDIGAIGRDMQWPLGCIDWEKAASELQTDYSSVEFDGDTYWYRG